MKMLKDLRKNRGLSLREVARLTGFSLRTVHRHELGESSISLKQAQEYAKLYSVSINKLAQKGKG